MLSLVCALVQNERECSTLYFCTHGVDPIVITGLDAAGLVPAVGRGETDGCRAKWLAARMFVTLLGRR